MVCRRQKFTSWYYKNSPVYKAIVIIWSHLTSFDL